jgi:hypothetical protein
VRALLEMKRQISWQEQDLNIRSKDLNQLAASQLELPRNRSGTGLTEIIKITLGIRNRAYTGKGTYTRALCQKNEGSVEIKQRPTEMNGRTTYRTQSPKRTPFQIGVD